MQFYMLKTALFVPKVTAKPNNVRTVKGLLIIWERIANSSNQGH